MRAVKEVQAPLPEGEPLAGTVDRWRNYPGRARQFLHDVRLEMRNVTWPTWQDVRATTVVVLATSFFFGYYLWGVLDIPLNQLVLWLFKAAKAWVR